VDSAQTRLAINYLSKTFETFRVELHHPYLIKVVLKSLYESWRFKDDLSEVRMVLPDFNVFLKQVSKYEIYTTLKSKKGH